MTHFLDLCDLSPEQLRHLLDEAHRIKQARLKTARPTGAPDDNAPLAGHILAMIFDKPSTRTRLSFDVAMRQMGGSSLILNRAEAQFGRGESFADTARVVARLADILMLRTTAHSNIEEMAQASSIPVINGLTDKSHPCQIVADLMTFEEHKGALKGKRLAWIGDGNNVARSFTHAAPLLGFEFAIASPQDFSLGADELRAKNITACATPEEAAKGASAIITDCWVSMGDASENKRARKQVFAPYQITPELMALGDEAIFMHCLPAYRGEEVVSAVIDGAHSRVFDEAENRMHAQKAILAYVLQASL